MLDEPFFGEQPRFWWIVWLRKCYLRPLRIFIKDMRYFVRERGESHVLGPFDVEELKAQMDAKTLSNAHVVLLENGQTAEQLQSYWDFKWMAISNVAALELDPPAMLTPETAAIVSHTEKANHDMMVGGLWFFGGLAVTSFTFLAASGGGSYMVAWGAILFGGIQFFRGVLSK